MEYCKNNSGQNNVFFKGYEFILMTPEGIIIEDQDKCWELIFEYNLKTCGLYAVARGKYKHHKGFQCRFIDAFFPFISIEEFRTNVTYCAKFPDGHIETGISNAKEFSKNHGIDSSTLIKCAKGNPKIKHAQGFQLRYEDDRFFEFFTISELFIVYCVMFPNDTIETGITNISEFARKHNISVSNISKCATKNSNITHISGFQFRYEDSDKFFPFLDPTTVIKRIRKNL